MITENNENHVLGLSGGRDSAALAVYMRQNHPDLDIEYFFTDTGKEFTGGIRVLGSIGRFLRKTNITLEP